MSSLISVDTIHCIYSSCLYGFNFLCLTVLEIFVWKITNCYETFKCLKTGEKEKWRNKGMYWQYQQYKRYIHLQSTCVTSFKYLGLTVPEKSVMKKFNVWKLERKKNEKKRWISSSSLIAVYTIHPPIVHVCTKFHLSRTHMYSSWKKCYKNFNVGKLERKKNEEIKKRISSSLILVYTIHPPIIHVCNKFQPSRPHCFFFFFFFLYIILRR